MLIAKTPAGKLSRKRMPELIVVLRPKETSLPKQIQARKRKFSLDCTRNERVYDSVILSEGERPSRRTLTPYALEFVAVISWEAVSRFVEPGR